MSETFERRVSFERGFDCIRFHCLNGDKTCIPGKGGSHGRHGLNIRWLLIGCKGAVQFLLYTGWLPEPDDPSLQPISGATGSLYPLPADLGYHALEPQYEDQEQMECHVLLGGFCYYDGSGLNAKDAFRALCNGGEDALWSFLEGYYECRFLDGDYPKVPEYAFSRRRS